MKRQGAECHLLAGQALVYDPSERGLPLRLTVPGAPLLEFPLNDNRGFATQKIKLKIIKNIKEGIVLYEKFKRKDL